MSAVDCGNLEGLFIIIRLKKKKRLKEGAKHAFLRHSHKNKLKMDKRTCRKKLGLSLPVKRTLCPAATECGSSQNTRRQEIPHFRMCFNELQPYERSYSNPVNPNHFPASLLSVLHSASLSSLPWKHSLSVTYREYSAD